MTKFIYLLCAFSLLSACNSAPPDSPEQQIRDTLQAIEEAAELRSLSGVMEHVSDDYEDHNGNTKKDIQRLVQFQIIRNQKINVFTLIRSLQVDADLASVELSAAMSARELDLADESNRLRADTYRFSVVLAQDDERWQVKSVSWQRGW